MVPTDRHIGKIRGRTKLLSYTRSSWEEDEEKRNSTYCRKFGGTFHIRKKKKKKKRTNYNGVFVKQLKATKVKKKSKAIPVTGREGP
jgi:hypothetical protein